MAGEGGGRGGRGREEEEEEGREGVKSNILTQSTRMLARFIYGKNFKFFNLECYTSLLIKSFNMPVHCTEVSSIRALIVE